MAIVRDLILGLWVSEDYHISGLQLSSLILSQNRLLLGASQFLIIYLFIYFFHFLVMFLLVSYGICLVTKKFVKSKVKQYLMMPR